ncbi:MAG: sigma-B regulation protein RsbU (phosphoserine phosphatase) [Halocynthiibacter sp.]
MTVALKIQEAASPVPDQGVVRKVLVVDDSRAQRRILSSYLARWGYQVFEAESGMDALTVCSEQDIDLIVSDWMMPGMNGLDFCREFRGLDRENYGYFILLTSKSEKAEIARGLDVGADDFLTKPVAGDELLARIRAGERILAMERELTEKNRLVSSTLAEISTLYESLDRDLIEARKLQQSLVRERFRDFGPAQVSLFLRPCGHVGGDLVGFFPINETQIGAFSIDVSGHGVASALMTARLAAYLSGASPSQNLALKQNSDGTYAPLPPSEVAERLNRLILEEMETEHYFTMLLAVMDLTTGHVLMTQCGHPHPAIQRKDGSIEFLGDGGMPVGLIAGATYDDFEAKLESGDRLLLFSDGITECPDGKGGMLEEEGLVDIMKTNQQLKGPDLFEALIWDLNKYAQDQDFPDDISAILLEYSAPKDGA